MRMNRGKPPLYVIWPLRGNRRCREETLMYRAIPLLCLALLSSCSWYPFAFPASRPADAAHNSRNALDWPGTYQSLLPCADCEAILTTLTLEEDGNYQIKRLYVGQDDLLFDTSGRFTWSDDSSRIQLDIGDAPDTYVVEENRLVQLDMDAERITGDLADRYVLHKVEDPDPLITPVSFPLMGTRWELATLRGQDLPADLERKPWLLLERDGTVKGFGGCNSFSGSYTLDGLRLRFNDVASTLMACLDQDMNDAMLEVLDQVDNYTRSSNTLSLNRARMAPLAAFRATAP